MFTWQFQGPQSWWKKTELHEKFYKSGNCTEKDIYKYQKFQLQVECKKAQPKEVMMPQAGRGNYVVY